MNPEKAKRKSEIKMQIAIAGADRIKKGMAAISHARHLQGNCFSALMRSGTRAEVIPRAKGDRKQVQ